MGRKRVTEIAREQETFRYDSALVSNTIRNDLSDPLPPSSLRPCPDLALTALAALGLSRINGTRALISLFDRQFQHVVTEVTPSCPLVPATPLPPSHTDQGLWLCGTAVPRAGLCEHVLMQPEPDKASIEQLPVTVITDISQEPDFAQDFGCCTWPHHRFYTGVPIRSRRGINIGVFCVFDTQPRSTFDEASIQLMRSISEGILAHLEMRLASSAKHSGDRMVRGLGSFVEGKSTISGWHHGEDRAMSVPKPAEEGAFNERQQILQRHQGGLQEEQEEQEHELNTTQPTRDVSASSTGLSITIDSGISRQASSFRDSPSDQSYSVTTELVTPEDDEESQLRTIFSRAANIIRESIEVEGVVFLNASIGSPAGYASAGNVLNQVVKHSRSLSTSSLSSLEESLKSVPPRASLASEDSHKPLCNILGFSTSTTSSIDGASPDDGHMAVPERFLLKLLNRHPNGKIFNFDENGAMLTSDTSSSEATVTDDGAETLEEETNTAESQTGSRYGSSRQNEGKVIMKLFPGARAVCLVPLWDHNRQRWFAGGFVHTKVPMRIFTVEGELSYLSAFGAVIMSDVSQQKEAAVRSMTSDLLGSLSHELRSPLHGVTLGAELLRDTSLNVFQADVLRSLETCGRTLLDTINHLLHWTKINRSVGSSGVRSQPGENSRPGMAHKSSMMSGLTHLACDLDLDILAEEVVECVYAGYVFQRQSESGSDSARSPEESHARFTNKLERMESSGNTMHTKGSVMVLIDIDPTIGWIFHAEPGALRRILMNIYGNSLKYTSNGYIHVCLHQVDDEGSGMSTGEKIVKMVVTDTGCGIGEEYLRHRIFTPFAQEDVLSSGAGLGLSLVKQIVKALRGSIQVRSKLNSGTEVTVTLPLRDVNSTTPETEQYKSDVNELSSLRVALIGFTGPPSRGGGYITDASLFDEKRLLTRLCEKHLCLQVVKDADSQSMLPDLILCDQSQLALVMGRASSDRSPPVIVVCNSPTSARQLEQYYRSVNRRNKGLFSYISRPLGPRKLCKAFLLCFKRWIRLQSGGKGGISLSTLADDSMTMPTTDIGPVEEKQPGYFDSGPASQPWINSPETDSGVAGAKTPVPTTSTLETKGSSLSLSFPPHSPPKRFLLVEDNAINMRLLQAYMKKLGQPYDSVTDGRQALDVYKNREGQYQCIFMDISMPFMDGFEATRHIREFEKEKQLTRCLVMALTGLASKEAQEEAVVVGVDVFLSKPVKFKELSQVLESRDLV